MFCFNQKVAKEIKFESRMADSKEDKLKKKNIDLNVPNNRPLIVAVVLFDGFELLDIAAPVELLQAEKRLFKLVYCVAGNPTNPRFSSCMRSLRGDEGPAFQPTHEMLIEDNGTPILNGIHLQDQVNEYNNLQFDIILIPGGIGVRKIVGDQDFKNPDDTSLLKIWIKKACNLPSTKVVFTVCTGSWLIGHLGLLDGKRATSNKVSLAIGKPQSLAPKCDWNLKARWVEFYEENSSSSDVELPENADCSASGTKLWLTSSGVSAGGDAALALIKIIAGEKSANEVANNAEWNWHKDKDSDPFYKE